MSETRAVAGNMEEWWTEFHRIVQMSEFARAYRTKALMAWVTRQIEADEIGGPLAAAVVKLHSNDDEYRGAHLCASCGSSYTSEDPTDWPCETFAAVAQHYAGNGGFQPEWLDEIEDEMPMRPVTEQ